jgi:Ni,Fe-hydrogenase maturation factor
VTGRHPPLLVLGLGNDILGDDAVGLLAARRLRRHLPASIPILESASGGLTLAAAGAALAVRPQRHVG